MEFVPDLAVDAPLWLSLLTVGVNAAVGSLPASKDSAKQWDIVGLTTFGLLMGLGGGFIRDFLIGNLPVESLRTPWYLVTVLGVILLVLLLGNLITRARLLVALLNALALGLFAITGTAYALREGLPVISAVFVGVVSAVGGGVLVSVIKDEVPGILLTSAPNALVALLVALVYAAVDVADSRLAGVAAIIVAIATYGSARVLGIRTRRADGASALLLTRTRSKR